MSTPHINAKPEDFAKTVLMPGDPLRSRFIAENFLENPVLVNNVRGVQGYTGTYKGTTCLCEHLLSPRVEAAGKTQARPPNGYGRGAPWMRPGHRIPEKIGLTVSLR